MSYAVAAIPVAVRLLDALSGAPITGQQITVFEQSADDGHFLWRRIGLTGTDGWARVDAPASTSGGHYLVRAKPFAQWIERVLPRSGTVTLAAGPVRIDVHHGVSGTPLGGTELRLLTKSPDGSYSGITNVTTESDGSVRLDPTALGEEVYVLRGVSPVDGSNKYSAPITAAGTFTFSLGNSPVTMRLTDWSSAAPLVSQRVEVRERAADGTLNLITARSTDGDGRVKIDLDGLGVGRRYVLRTKPYLQAIEREVSQPGWLAVRAGAVPVTVLNGDTGLPLVAAEVSLLRRFADGTYKHAQNATTGENGILRFDPSDLGQEGYVLRALSPVDGTFKYSALIRRAGPLTFAVGNRGLTLRVIDAQTQQPLAALPLTAYEVLANDARGAGKSRTTDATGIAKFDLDGLGNGRRYVVRMRPFAQTIERPVETPGWMDIDVGQVRVSVVHGVSGRPLANTPVKLLALQPDGTRRHVQIFNSDANGSLILDPEELGRTPYMLSAASPVDGSTKFSAEIAAPGDSTFAVGGAGMSLRLTDWTSGLPLSGVPIKVLEIAPDGSRRQIAQRTTGQDGRLKIDVEGLGTGRRYVLRLRPYLQWIEREITATGSLTIRAGNVRATVMRGDNGQVLANAAVKLLTVLPDGNYEAVTTLTTSASGELLLDLPDPGPAQYVLRAASPMDGTRKYSTPITRPGPVQFRVGNQGLRITLTDNQTRAPLSAQALRVYEVQADQTRTWVTQRSTDNEGAALFDLDGLGQGRRYVVRSKPYAQWIEQIVTETGNLAIEAGRAPVRLIDQDLGAPMAGVAVRAYNKAANGALSSSIGSGFTDAEGVIRFDPPGLGGGAVVVYAALNPFATGVNYYSKPITAAGPSVFALSRKGPEALDRMPAELEVTVPRLQQDVSTGGFVLTGHAHDAIGLQGVEIAVHNGSETLQKVSAQVDPITRRWTVRIGALSASPGARLTVTVTATDAAYNATTLAIPVRVVTDVSAPTVTFTSPSEESTTNSQGLLVLGTVQDDTRWADLYVRLESESRELAPYRPVEVDRVNGNWAVAVPANILRGLNSVTIRMKAKDVTGNIAESARSVVIDPDADALRHLIARITFGETPELYVEAKRLGFRGFLDQQLAPALIDDSELESRVPRAGVVNYRTLQEQTLVRMIASRRQLNELMTWFWDNHFNTNGLRHGRFEWEQQENYAFRARALGRFRDLLAISAHSPAMLHYLDNAFSRKRIPNENYARELLELHTLATGYNQKDIVETARAFTGWTFEGHDFLFNPRIHADGEKRVLDLALPAGRGVLDGERILDLLAAHPATARHICSKLAQVLVADKPPGALVTRCANVFLAQQGAPDQIGQVLREILASPEFASATNRKNKTKTSLEFLAGIVRGTNALRTGWDLPMAARNLGQPLFVYPVPTGYSHASDAWTSPFLLRQRLALIGTLLESAQRNQALNAEPDGLLAGLPVVSTTEGVAARVLQNAFGGAFDDAELAAAMGVLTDHGSLRFELPQPNAPALLNRLARTVLSLPRYQLR